MSGEPVQMRACGSDSGRAGLLVVVEIFGAAA